MIDIHMTNGTKGDMDNREFQKILASAEQLRLRETQAEPWTDHYSDMNFMEESMLLDELFALCKADKEKLLFAY